MAGDPRFMGLGAIQQIPLVTAPSFDGFAISASGIVNAVIFQAPEAATITHLGFRYSLRTGTPPTYRISLQSVGTDGNPSGTVLGGGSPASATFTPPADTTWNSTWQWIALDNSYVCAQGDYLAWVIDYSSGTVNGSNSGTFTYGAESYSLGGRIGLPYVTINTAGSGFSKQGGPVPVYGYKSSSQVYGWPVLTLDTIATAGSGTRAALRFKFASGIGSTYKVAGLRWVGTTPGAGTTWKIGLWKTDNTELQALSMDSDNVRVNAGTYNGLEAYFSSVVALDFGTAYYVGVQRDGTTDMTVYAVTGSAANDMKAFPGGSELYAATYNGTTWTETTTTRPLIELILADITAPAGGSAGMLFSPGLDGGAN